jgi:isocitrate lyase
MPKYEPNPFRTYTPEDVKRLQGSYVMPNFLAEKGAQKLWDLFNTQPFVRALGAYNGAQAVASVRGGLQSIYLSGWMASGDGQAQTYPDMSLLSVDTFPKIVRRLNNALLRMDQIECQENGKPSRDWLVPIVADIESGGGVLNAFEITKAMIESGASFCHVEDQSAQAGKKCGHNSGKVLVPTKTFIKQLISCRLSADVCGNPSVGIIARTDSMSGEWITSEADPYDRPFIDFDTRNDDGFYKLKGDPMERCVARAIAYGKYADCIWAETSTPNLQEAKIFADNVHAVYPNMPLAYNCSPSFNWKRNLSDKEIAEFQYKLGEMGYVYQFITLAGYHTNSLSAYKLAYDYNKRGMPAFVDVQNESLQWAQDKGYTAVRHQREVATGYFDAVRQVIDGHSDMSALANSTEAHQF